MVENEKITSLLKGMLLRNETFVVNCGYHAEIQLRNPDMGSDSQKEP
jgi:hypothetical protein